MSLIDDNEIIDSDFLSGQPLDVYNFNYRTYICNDNYRPEICKFTAPAMFYAKKTFNDDIKNFLYFFKHTNIDDPSVYPSTARRNSVYLECLYYFLSKDPTQLSEDIVIEASRMVSGDFGSTVTLISMLYEFASDKKQTSSYVYTILSDLVSHGYGDCSYTLTDLIPIFKIIKTHDKTLISDNIGLICTITQFIISNISINIEMCQLFIDLLGEEWLVESILDLNKCDGISLRNILLIDGLSTDNREKILYYCGLNQHDRVWLAIRLWKNNVIRAHCIKKIVSNYIASGYCDGGRSVIKRVTNKEVIL